MTPDVGEDLAESALIQIRDIVPPTLAFSPNLQIVSQSILDCSDAAGEVNSIFIKLYQHVSFHVYASNITYVVHTKIVQSLGNLNLLWKIEEGIGKLFTLT